MTPSELFDDECVWLTALFVGRMWEGEDTQDLASILFDPYDDALPEELGDALDLEMSERNEEDPQAPQHRLGTLFRLPLADALAATHPAVSIALKAPTRLDRVPCVVVTGGTLSLFFYAVEALRWTEGGDA